MNVKKKFSVVMVPDYIVKTLNAGGTTLEMLDAQLGNNEQNSLDRNAYDAKCEQYFKKFKEKYSTHDIYDLVVAQEVLRDYIQSGRYIDDLGVARFISDRLKYGVDLYFKDSQEKCKEFIALYSNNKDKDTIIMNGDKTKTYDFVVTENTLYVVLHDGFTNFIVYNDTEFKKLFLFSLINFLFNAYGEDTVYNSDLFELFMNF